MEVACIEKDGNKGKKEKKRKKKKILTR